MAHQRPLPSTELTCVLHARVLSQSQGLRPLLVEVVVELASRFRDKDRFRSKWYVVTVMAWELSSDILACEFHLSVSYWNIRSCKGRGTTTSTAKETVTIPKGVDNGVNLRVAKKGHSSSSGTPGDLMI